MRVQSQCNLLGVWGVNIKTLRAVVRGNGRKDGGQRFEPGTISHMLLYPAQTLVPTERIKRTDELSKRDRKQEGDNKRGLPRGGLPCGEWQHQPVCPGNIEQEPGERVRRKKRPELRTRPERPQQQAAYENKDLGGKPQRTGRVG